MKEILPECDRPVIPVDEECLRAPGNRTQLPSPLRRQYFEVLHGCLQRVHAEGFTQGFLACDLESGKIGEGRVTVEGMGHPGTLAEESLIASLWCYSVSRQPPQTIASLDSSIGELDVRIHAYGSEEYFVIPGIADAPDDWEELAQAMGSTLVIAENPFHQGKLLHKDHPDWQKKWRGALLKKIRGRFSKVMGHSAGAADLLHIEKQIDLEHAVLLNPPTKASYHAPADAMDPDLGPGDGPDVRIVDSLLWSLKGKMPMELYRKFRARHVQYYGSRVKKIIKAESPEITGITADFSRILINATRARLTIVIGLLDHWEELVRRNEILQDKSDAEVGELDTGHWSAVEDPQGVRRIILGK